MDWLCIRKCYLYSLLWEVGDIAVSEENMGPHIVPYEGLEGTLVLSGRKWLVEDGHITGVWE